MLPLHVTTSGVRGSVQAGEDGDGADISRVGTSLAARVGYLMDHGDAQGAVRLFEQSIGVGDGAAGPPPRRKTSVRACNDALKRICAKGYRASEAALRCYDAMEGSRVQPTAVTLSILMSHLNRAEQPLRAVKLFQRACRRGLRADVVVYNTLLNSLGCSGQPEVALKAFKAMKLSGVQPTTATYNTLIGAAAKRRDIRAVRQLLAEMEATEGVVANTRTYNSIIAACAAQGNLRAAVGYAERARAAGVQLDEFSHSCVIDCAVKGGSMQLALKWLRAMKVEGLEPNVVIWTSVIDGCGKAGRTEAARTLFEQMRRTGVKPTVVTVSALLDAHLKKGELSEALDLLAIMREEGLRPNGHIFTSIQKAAQNSGDLAPLTALRAMSAGEEPAGGAPQLDTAVRLVTSDRDLDVASKALWEAWQRGEKSRELCRELLRACGRLRQLPRAVMVLTAMAESGLALREGDFLPLMDGCRASGDPSAVADAFKIMQRFQKRNRVPRPEPAAASLTPPAVLDLGPSVSSGVDSQLTGVQTYTRLMAAVGELDRVRKRQGQGQEQGGEPPAGAARDREQRLRQYRDHLYKVFLVFRQMQSEGVDADVTAFNGLLSACANAGDTAKAEEVFSEMMDSGLMPDQISYTALLKAHHVAGDADGAERVYDEMMARSHHFKEHLRPTEAGIAHVMGANVRAGRNRRVRELFRQLKERGLRPSFLSLKYALAACREDARDGQAVAFLQYARDSGLPLQGDGDGDDAVSWAKRISSSPAKA